MSNELEIKKSESLEKIATTIDYEVGMKEFEQYIWPSKMDRKPTEREAMLYIRKWKALEANPWTKDVMLVPYFSKKENQYIVTEVFSKEYYLKRADNFEDYKGFKAGLVVFDPKNKGREFIEGEIVPDEWTILGGWCEVYRFKKERIRCEISFNRYKNDNNSLWDRFPETMIRKTAIVHAFKEAYPKQFDGIEEISESDAEQEAVVMQEAVVEKTAPALAGGDPMEMITDKQKSILKSFINLDPVQVKNYILAQFGKNGSKDLTKKETDLLIKFIVNDPNAKSLFKESTLTEKTVQETFPGAEVVPS